MIASRTRRPPRGMTVIALLACLVVITLDQWCRAQGWSGPPRLDSRRSTGSRPSGSPSRESSGRSPGLPTNREYDGEAWSISAADLGLPARRPPTGTTKESDRAAAVVTIAVERVPGGATRRRVRVQADYPRDVPERSRHSKEVMIDLENIEQKPNR